MSTKDGERAMSTRDAALAGCSDGFEEAIQRMTGVLLGGWSLANDQAHRDQAVNQFRAGLEKYKEAYERAQQVIVAVFP
jgi:hypothetical protein